MVRIIRIGSRKNRSFEDMTLYSGFQNYNASGVDLLETIVVTRARDNFFSVLGIQAQFGRAFAPGKTRTAMRTSP